MRRTTCGGNGTGCWIVQVELLNLQKDGQFVEKPDRQRDCIHRTFSVEVLLCFVVYVPSLIYFPSPDETQNTSTCILVEDVPNFGLDL